MTGRLEQSRRRRFMSGFLVPAACAIAVAGSGCGSSSGSSSPAHTSTAASPAASHPLTKAQYEQKLGPLLNDVVVPALHSALSNGGAASPQKLTAAITAVRLAHDQMAAVAPPVAVADLHKRAVAVMASMIGDMTRLRGAETSQDKKAISSAALALVNDARQIETVGSQFTSRGY